MIFLKFLYYPNFDNNFINMSKTKKVGKNESITEHNVPGIDIGIYKDLYNAAENGNDSIQFKLAYLYHNGKGIEKNLEKAFYWYQKAAENSYNAAQYILSTLYKDGKGTEMNLEKSFYWCQKVAENGIKEAQCKLASLYYNGEGTEKNLKNAFY